MVTGRDSKLDLQLLSQCGSTDSRLTPLAFAFFATKREREEGGGVREREGGEREGGEREGGRERGEGQVRD